jgi:hypothetical protein
VQLGDNSGGVWKDHTFHTSEQKLNTKREGGKKRKKKQRERCDAYMGASSGGVWKGEESILPHLLLPDRHRDL